MIGQGHTQEILRSHLSKYGVMVELNTELLDFEQHADGVTVNLLKRNKSAEQTEKISVDWLVGADGARSKHSLHLHCYTVKLIVFRPRAQATGSQLRRRDA